MENQTVTEQTKDVSHHTAGMSKSVAESGCNRTCSCPPQNVPTIVPELPNVPVQYKENEVMPIAYSSIEKVPLLYPVPSENALKKEHPSCQCAVPATIAQNASGSLGVKKACVLNHTSDISQCSPISSLCSRCG